MKAAESDYWVCAVTKDGAATLREALDSIFTQDFPPAFVVVVDDGSTDGTQELLRELSSKHSNLFAVRNNSTRRDIRRVPALLNLGISFAEGLSGKLGSPRYMMVSGDDNRLTKSYASSIIRRMDDSPKVAVASGAWIASSGRSNQMPHGAGRVVRMDFMRRVGGRYPVAYGWEAWLLYKALQAGLTVKNYRDVRYDHLRPYNPGNLAGWGRAMYSLGFPSYFVFLRVGINLVWSRRGTQSVKGGITMAAGYLSSKTNPSRIRRLLIDDEGVKAFVRRYAARRLARPLW